MEENFVDSEFCDSCKKYIIAANFTSHSAFCQRNVKACNLCGEQIFKDLIEEHEAKYHISVACDICSATVEKWMLPKHQEECKMRLIFCEFCSSNLPFNTFAEHIDFCESRTEKCPLCSKYIMLKDKKKHSEFHQHEENSLKKDSDPEADQNSVSNLVEQEFKKIQTNYLPRHFNHPGSSMSGGTSFLPRNLIQRQWRTLSRGTSQNDLENCENYFEFPPVNGASNIYAPPLFGPSYSMNSKQVNPSLASAFSAPPARKPITDPSTSNYLFKKGNEETNVKHLPKNFSNYSAASMSGGTLQNNLSNGKKFYLHPSFSRANNLIMPQPFYSPYVTNSKQVSHPNVAAVSSDQSTVKLFSINNHSIAKALFKPTNEKTLATNEKLPEQEGQATNINPTFSLFPSEPECDSAEGYFQCHLCCENVLQKDRDMHLSSTCIMLQEDISSVPYTCPLCNKIMPEKDKTIHELFECSVLIEANEQSSDSEDEIHFLGMKTNENAKTTAQKNLLGNYASETMPSYSGNTLNNLMSTASAMKACARKAMLKKLQEEKNESKMLSKEAKESCPTCNKFIRLLDYHLHVPFCANIPRRASSRQVTTQNLQKNKSEADLKARAKYEQTLKSLTTSFCNEQKKIETSRNEKKHGSDPNESGNALRAKQPCKMKLGNYPIFNFDKQTTDSFGSSLASQSTSSEIAHLKSASMFPGPYPILNFGEQNANLFGSSMASPSTSRGITHGKETNTLSDKNSEAKGSSDDDGLWSSEVKLPKCIICIMNDRSIVFQPCGHLVVCSSCANIKMVDCPVCRKRIKGKLKTYIS